MNITDFEYVKRYQMLFELNNGVPEPRELPAGFFWIPWQGKLVDAHARVQYEGFRNEIDALIFPTFTRLDTCLRLLRQITSNPNFVPQATWLIGRHNEMGNIEYCATIQGMKQSPAVGSIQNIAVLAPWRRQGLGRALITNAIDGFRKIGCSRVVLEVTAENAFAISMYRKIGFTIRQTTFKETCFSNPFF